MQLPVQTLFQSSYTPIIVNSTIFIIIMGFIYAYIMQFLFGLKKTIMIGFFVIVLASIIVLLFSSGFILQMQCQAGSVDNQCNMTAISNIGVALFLAIAHFFINLIFGHIGILLGIALLYPSERFLKKSRLLSQMQSSAQEMNDLNAQRNTVITGSLNVNKIEKNRSIINSNITIPVNETQPQS